MVYLFDKLEEFKEKFQHLLVHEKKILALDNLSQSVPFNHMDYLVLIKKCLKNGFLSPEENSFLVYLVGKYFSDKNFLDWTHRTHWLKGEMRRLSRENKPAKTVMQQDLFNWSKLREQTLSAKMPAMPLASQSPQRQARV
jgi:hypothetical protein